MTRKAGLNYNYEMVFHATPSIFYFYYVASHSHANWLVFGRDFTVRTITMKMVRFRIFSLSREIQVERNTKVFKKRN